MEQSEMNLDFDKVYAIPVTCLRIIRNHPEVPQNVKWGLQVFAMFFFFTVPYVATVYNVVIAAENGNFSEACRNTTVTVMFWVVIFQYFVIVVKKDNVMNIINRMKNDFKKKLPDDEKLIVLNYAKKGNSVCRNWFAMSFSTGVVFPIKFIVLELYLYIVGDFRPVMMFPMILPSPLEEHKMEPFLFICITSLVVYFVFYAVCTFTSFVPLGPLFMLHACGQLEIIKNRVSTLYVNGEDTKAKLIEIVKELQYIYEFVEYINDTFRVICEISMKGSTIMIPITLYQILESFRRGEFSLEFTGFIISSTVISSMPCYYSDMLMEKGEDVRLAVYSCGWETVYDHGTRTTNLLILQRALRPCSIRALFRTMNLDALTDMFQQAYAIFNLMNAAWG